ncbi:MAG: S41 family peptidase, partial [Balneolaceae bacterium]
MISSKRTAVLLAALIGLMLITTAWVRTSDLYFEIKKQLTIFNDVFKEVHTLYLEDVEPQRLMNRSINAMLEELDPYTTFINEGEQQRMEILSSGSYGGVGIDAGFRGDDIVVIAPLEGYPAERSGIRPGDVIRAINGLPVRGLIPEEVQNLTTG